MRRSVGLLLLVGVSAGVSAGSSVLAASSLKVTWKVSSLTAGEARNLSAVVSTNSPGVKTWSKRGTCTLTPTRKPTKLVMGATGSCELILKIAKSKNYPPITSRKTITLERTYAVGETGPGGGIVFYDAGTAQPWGRYLEAAPTDYQVNGVRASVEWGCRYTSTGANATAIGTGKTNTATILTKCTTAGIAADVANKYSTNTAAAGQWFLPSKDELNEMYFNRATIGGFVADSYWSSSERFAEYSWFQIFLDGPQYGLSKDSTAYVRPVRAFFATSSTSTTPTTTSSTIPKTCVPGGACKVGDIGSGGGIVFYDAGTEQPWGRYLEAAPTDYQLYGMRARVGWGCDGITRGKTATAIGTGYANTARILSGGLSKCVSGGTAAEVANKYSTHGDGGSSTSEDAVSTDDGWAGQWFLPSKDELKLMYDNKVAIGGFSPDDSYWSSSEDDASIAWAQNFNKVGLQYYSNKYSSHYVRPVRAFSTTTPREQIAGDTKCPATDGTAVRTTNFTKAPPMCIDAKKSYMATFNTSEGTIVIALDTTKTPKTVNNFVTLSRYKYYDGSFIFRTDPSIDIIQGGGESNTDDPGYTIEDEGNGYKYTEGDIVMARTGEINSAGGQFFIVTGPKASFLDDQGTYVVFGKISKGLDVAKAILGLNAGSGQLGGAPSRAVKITSVTITEK